MTYLLTCVRWECQLLYNPACKKYNVQFQGGDLVPKDQLRFVWHAAPNPWHVSFSYARALQNTVLKTWQGEEGNWKAAQDALSKRAAANSAAQKGEYDPSKEGSEAGENMYQKGYTY